MHDNPRSFKPFIRQSHKMVKHSNNWSAICRRIVWLCSTILRGSCLKGWNMSKCISSYSFLAFHIALLFMWSEKSNCMVDNIHLEKYVESMLNVYVPVAKPSSYLFILVLYSMKYMPRIYHSYCICVYRNFEIF